MPYVSDETAELMTNPDMDELAGSLVNRIIDLLTTDEDIADRLMDIEVDTWLPDQLPPPDLQIEQMDSFTWWALQQKVKAQLDLFFAEHATPKCPSCGSDLYLGQQYPNPTKTWRHAQLSPCIGAKPA